MTEMRLPPTRLVEESLDPDDEHGDLARVLRATGNPPALDGFAVSRIERRLRASTTTTATRLRARLTPALIGVVAFGFGGVIATAATIVGGGSWSWRQLLSVVPQIASRPAPSSPSKRAGAAGQIARSRSVPDALVAPEPPGEKPAPSASPPELAAVGSVATAAPALPTAAPPAAVTTPPPDGLPTPRLRGGAAVWRQPAATIQSSVRVSPPRLDGASSFERARSDEVRLFAQAVAGLRREGQAREAIGLCDEYLRRFPSGALAEEVEAVRAEAALVSGDHGLALAGLGRLALRDDERGMRLRLARAELRAEGNCTTALQDFDRVLAGRPEAALVERALYGRSVCRARTGDEGGAAADARLYVRQFPQGPRAPLLRRRAGL